MMGLVRDYSENDYAQCEELVNQAWGFDRIFPDKELANIAKCIYTKGSVLGSNYKRVVDVNGEIAGFIFGLNEFSQKPGRNILFGLKMLWRLIRIKSDEAGYKEKLLNAIKFHESNRAKVLKKGRSEIVLFVVSDKFQGEGLGTQLWLGFLEHCKNSEVKSVVVETNHHGASRFYERLGFKHFADFDSPLHELATPNGQACIYEYICD